MKGACEIHKYLPGVICTNPARLLWGYGSIIKVCDFHSHLHPHDATEQQLRTELAFLVKHETSPEHSTGAEPNTPDHKYDVQFGDRELMNGWNGLMNQFGLCPFCFEQDSCANMGSEHWFYCKTHKVKWCPGTNLLSSWKRETEDQQRKAWEALGMEGFKEVRPAAYSAEERKDEERANRIDFEEYVELHKDLPIAMPFEIEYELFDGTIRQGLVTGESPGHAIKNFLAEYPSNEQLETIVAIRVPSARRR
jgi:hypothetical protein